MQMTGSKHLKISFLLSVPIMLFITVQHVCTSTPQYCYHQILVALQDHNDQQLQRWTTAQARASLQDRITENVVYTGTCDDKFTYSQRCQAYADFLMMRNPTWNQLSAHQAIATFADASQEVLLFKHTDHGWILDNVDVRNGAPDCAGGVGSAPW